MNEEIAPNRDRLDQLKCGGLGKKRITFNKDGDHAYFIKKLEEEFPKLQLQQGAIEVLRSSTGGSGARPLTPIPLGSQGYCIQELRASLKVARYSFSGSIPPNFERKLRRHKQRFGKINTTVVLDKDENWL